MKCLCSAIQLFRKLHQLPGYLDNRFGLLQIQIVKLLGLHTRQPLSDFQLPTGRHKGMSRAKREQKNRTCLFNEFRI